MRPVGGTLNGEQAHHRSPSEADGLVESSPCCQWMCEHTSSLWMAGQPSLRCDGDGSPGREARWPWQAGVTATSQLWR